MKLNEFIDDWDSQKHHIRMVILKSNSKKMRPYVFATSFKVGERGKMDALIYLYLHGQYNVGVHASDVWLIRSTSSISKP